MKNILVRLLPLILVGMISCEPKTPSDEIPVEENIQVENDNIDSDILEIKEACAVILMIDSIEVDSIKKVHPEDIYVEIFSDIGYYALMAEEDLTKKGIKVLEVDDRKMAFINSDGKRTIVHRNTYEKDMIFFSPDKEILGTFASNYEDDLSYFDLAKSK